MHQDTGTVCSTYYDPELYLGPQGHWVYPTPTHIFSDACQWRVEGDRETSGMDHGSLLNYMGMPLLLSLDFICCGCPSLLMKVPKREWWIPCGGALLGRVFLSLKRGFAADFKKARLGMRLGFRCTIFRWISLIWYVEWRSFCCSSG